MSSSKRWPKTYIQTEVLKSHIAAIRGVLGDDPGSPPHLRETFLGTPPVRAIVDLSRSMR